ncbi:hypothetical protein [Streptomyces abikoensis]|uniref:hypothetical protein n=1 Tax=Streptomyces abikoensis TaxID=97398 RepID=UPI001679533E|nr:hypothetical protein [Streptomyces abikoensis]GGP46811.1 hypothetical protein GCM10010214_19960 [Streptomyces abikoensis]
MYISDRDRLAAAYVAGRRDLVNHQAHSMALERRDDLLETGVVLDALALCHEQGAYLPRPYQEISRQLPEPGVELRTDVSDVADQLVRHDHCHGTSLTGNIPPGLEEGCTDTERDAVRAYLRREWLATRKFPTGD